MLGNIPIKNKLRFIVGLALLGIVLVAGIMLAAESRTMLDDRKLKTRNVVEVAHKLVEHHGQRAESGALTREEAQAGAIAALKTLRYDGQEYFWINDMQPRMVMHPIKPELDGKDVSETKDPAGKQLFVEFVNTVKKDGAGFVDYCWPKPGSKEPVEKISCVMGYQPWGWVIGSGIHIDDVDAAFRKTAGWLAARLNQAAARFRV